MQRYEIFLNYASVEREKFQNFGIFKKRTIGFVTNPEYRFLNPVKI